MDRYFKLGNKHIFVQMTIDSMNKIINLSKTKHNQIIHIFEVYPFAVENVLTKIIKHTRKDFKVCIHFASAFKDYKRYFEDKWKDLASPYWSISLEKHGMSFKYPKKEDEGKILRIIYDEDRTMTRQKDVYLSYTLRVMIEYMSFDMLWKNYHYSDGAIKTSCQKRYPELFKDVIIKNFKKVTPAGILQAFPTDEDIWEWIIQPTETDAPEDVKNTLMKEDETNDDATD